MHRPSNLDALQIRYSIIFITPRNGIRVVMKEDLVHVSELISSMYIFAKKRGNSKKSTRFFSFKMNSNKKFRESSSTQHMLKVGKLKRCVNTQIKRMRILRERFLIARSRFSSRSILLSRVSMGRTFFMRQFSLS